MKNQTVYGRIYVESAWREKNRAEIATARGGQRLNGQKNSNIYFTGALVFAIVATAVAFTLFFVTRSGGIYGKISAKSTSTEEASPNADIPALSEFKTVEEMQQAIDKYTEYLASDLLELVDNDNAVREKDIDLVSISGFSDIRLEREAAEKLEAFISQARKDGMTVTVFRGYTTAEEQQEYYDEEYRKNLGAGYTNEEMAEQRTLRSEGKPGHSEYQTGLAVAVGETASTEVSVVKNSAFYKYATENIWKYGFILSYPEDKTAVTGHAFEPWHFRYIGDSEQAQYIMQNGMCLEEYREYLTGRIETLKKNIEDENSKKLGTYNK